MFLFALRCLSTSHCVRVSSVFLFSGAEKKIVGNRNNLLRPDEIKYDLIDVFNGQMTVLCACIPNVVSFGFYQYTANHLSWICCARTVRLFSLFRTFSGEYSFQKCIRYHTIFQHRCNFIGSSVGLTDLYFVAVEFDVGTYWMINRA